MALPIATTLSFIVALILWALGVKFFDAFMITLLVVLLAVMAKVVVPALAKRAK